MNAKQLQQLEAEAVARITWGESPADIRAWLRENGMSHRSTATLICKCVRRRGREMRVLGTWNLIRGVFSLAVAMVWAVAVWYLWLWSRPPLMVSGVVSRLEGYGFGAIFAPAILLGIYGCGQVWLALDRLIFGANADGPVSDIED